MRIYPPPDAVRSLARRRHFSRYDQAASLSVPSAQNGRALDDLSQSPLAKSRGGFAHRSGKWLVAKIYRRTLDGVPFFVDDEAEAPVPVKESQPIATRILVDSPLAENRDLSFAHP